MAESARLRIGNQTAVTAPYVMRPFEYAVSNGFDAFEWFPDRNVSGAGWEESDISKETRMFIRDTAAARDISLSVHASLQSDLLKTESHELIFRAIEFAHDVGASLVNLHFHAGEGIAAFADAIVPVLKRAADAGIRLSIENTVDTSPEDFNKLFNCIHTAENTAGIGMCLDLGHANLCYETRNDYIKFIDLLDPEVPIIHVHMHENYGDYDSHLPVFTGPAGKDAAGIKSFIEKLKKRNFSGCIILEQWPQPESLLIEARSRLLEMIREGEETRISGDFADEIVDATRRFLSWRNRLGWIHKILTGKRNSGDTILNSLELSIVSPELVTDHLIYIAIYLHFIGTGEVPCSEDGGHHRPSLQAKMAQQIYGRLAEITTPENIFVMRQIYPWLPSFDSAFTRAEPLTRIRDIAHRNDIPRELKEEIKHSLQNKLHRSAGPEDLATSERLLKSITAPGAGYPRAFVEEFRQFHKELKEFFNAASLDERLDALTGELDSGTVSSISAFLAVKKKMNTPKNMLTALRLLTVLRNQFHEALKVGQGPKAQRIQLADIGLEDFSFVILGSLTGRLSRDFEILKDRKTALPALTFAIVNLRLSGFQPEECRVIELELAAWSQENVAWDRDDLLRMKATLNRCSRLTEDYCNKILSSFPEKAQRLGSALGVAEHAIRVYAEADIRGHLVFQVSKIADLLLRSIRVAANLPPWDVIVPGKAAGRLIAAGGFGDIPENESPAIALLEKVEGDEEIPAGVAGIIAAHEIPHLSHLAVRARQSHVVFAACEDRELFSGLSGLSGQLVEFDAVAEKAGIRMVPEISSGIPSGNSRRTISLPAVQMISSDKLLPLKAATPENSGLKAYSARRLEDLARRSDAAFKTAPAAVVPFGVMEASLRAEPAVEKEYRALIDDLNRAGENNFAVVLKKLRGIVTRLKVPAGIISGVIKEFTPDKQLMVRSSANCEDIKASAGAGLYDSASNVGTSGVPSAILRVWASLWNRRAVLSRRNAGIRNESAAMAVLIQEMLIPEISFIIHTWNPVTCNPDEVYIELAVGMGETLASAATPGSPYRMVCNKKTAETDMLSFASFSHALLPGPPGNVIMKTVCYSDIRLSTDRSFRDLTGRRLGAIGQFVENAFGEPQDIEGVISGNEIYLVQSRAQYIPSCPGAFSEKD
ncbi:MAG: TIM barrel protein [Nitrospirae bacterium]|nr:TIM barrel protein [Nitrospirota bacterium]